MKVQPQKTERIHSLDSLRAIMMLLGLVIHSAITYGVTDWGNAWSLKDPNTVHLSNDYIVEFIHAFRMQIFFAVAGFFGAMLFYERKPLKMIKNRVARIVMPFIVFVIILWPTILFTFTYTRLVFGGDPEALTNTLAVFSSWETFIPPRTFHLWFLYYLAIITLTSVVLGLIFKLLPNLSARISHLFRWIMTQNLGRIIIFASITGVVYLLMGTYQVPTSTSFIPDFQVYIYYLMFYMFGWILFKSKHLLGSFMKYDYTNTLVGVMLFTLVFFMEENWNAATIITVKSVMVWAFIFGITGLFIRFASNHSSKMRYISDSSYWVYLIHLSFTAILPGLIADWKLPSTLKFFLVLTVTGVICFVSYHYLVRGTFIGKFLNGRKYSRKISDIAKTAETEPQPLVEI